MNTHAKRRNTIKMTRMGAFCILLALTLTACDNGETNELSGETGIQQGMGDAQSGARMVTVSITDTGEMVPTVPAGRATFTVDGTTADCDLTLTPRGGGNMTGQGTMGEGATGEDAFSEEMGQDPAADATQNQDRPLGDDEGAMRDGANDGTGADRARQGQTAQGQYGNQTTAGQNGTVTVDLEPGLYEVSCVDGTDQQATGRQGMNRQGTDQQGTNRQGTNQQGMNRLGQNGSASPMLVMVTDDPALGTGGTEGTAQPDAGEGALGTDNE